MEIIPAIDIQGGKCVRLTQGEFTDSETYSDDPAEFATRWQSEGATRLHVVDLDGARLGAPQNLDVVRKICDNVTIPVQLGGGARNADTVARILDTGVSRVILGTRAAQDIDAFQQMLNRFGDKIILGIDARDGKVAVSGWQESLELGAVEFARRAESMGSARIIFTDIARDGMLQGVNMEALLEMLNSVSIPVIASGGVGSMEDIRALSAINKPNLEGCIVGKALYAGRVTLPECIRVSSIAQMEG